MSPTPHLSWVAPLYRTAAQVDELLARIHAASAALGVAHEVILVDDACPDGSGARAETSAAADARVRVVRLPANGGQDAALRAGLRLARGEWTLILDADLQDPPEAVRAFWPLRDVGADGIVFAERTGRYDTRRRLVWSRLFRVTATWLGGLPRGACLFALLGRNVVDRVAADAAPSRSLLAQLASSATRCTSIAVPRARRAKGTSAYSATGRTARAATVLWQLLRTRRARLPAIESSPANPP